LVVESDSENSDLTVAQNGHPLDLVLKMLTGTTIYRFSGVYDLCGLRSWMLAEKTEAVTAGVGHLALHSSAGVP
jgi:hypothetical protein